MKKFIYALIIISVFLITACDDTTTSDLLDGDFVPADTSPPSILGPEDGDVVLNLTADLSWTAKSGALYYIIDVTTDAGFASPITGSPITVNAPTNFYVLTLPAAGRYYWRVRASSTAAGQYDISYFDAKEDCLYVYFPYDPAHPDAKPDDTDRTGNIDAPFQSINRAMSEAYKLGISTVKVASRGEITAGSGNFAVYTEYFIFREGVSLLGAYSPDFSTRHDFSTGFDNNTYETRLEVRFDEAITLYEIFTPMVFQGFSIKTTRGIALRVSCCGKELTVEDCVLISEATSSSTTGLSVESSDSRIIHNYILTADNTGTETYGLSITDGDPEIINNIIISGAGTGFETNSYAVLNFGTAIMINNIIVSGDSTGLSCALQNTNDIEPILLNNTIIGGAGDNNSFTLYNTSGATPIAINNIIISTDSAGYGVYGSGAATDTNYYYNCIYSNGGTDYTGIALGTGNVAVDPALDGDHDLTASSPSTVTGGGVIDPFTIADITLLDEYLLDITGADRTPDYVQGSTDLGWSMGAYEY